MGCRKYLLSITELLKGSAEYSSQQLREFACSKLDEERLRKLRNIKMERSVAQCIGAGLLIQLGLQEIAESGRIQDCVEGESGDASIQHYTVSELLSKLGAPVEPEYIYGPKGKPFLKSQSTYFNLSHSEEYVFCVFADEEVGADIQFCKPGNHDRMVKRYFSEAERRAWENCEEPDGQEKLFFTIWTRKEAYGKLTGNGIADAITSDIMAAEHLVWEEYGIGESYRIAVCRYGQKKE